MRIYNFTYNGFYGNRTTTEADFTVDFKYWTSDPGIFFAKCSDGKERLIPSFALMDNEQLPLQDMSNKVLFGSPSDSLSV